MTPPIRAYNYVPPSGGMQLMAFECAEYPRRRARIPMLLSFLAVVGAIAVMCFAVIILEAIR